MGGCMSKTGLEFRSASRVSAKYLNLLASLWLCPPEGSPIEAALIRLITTTIPTHFGDEKVPSFRPHMTLTSDIPPGLDPQTVIDSITISELPEIVFSCMRIGNTFFTRGTLHLKRTSSLLNLAAQCREKFTFGGQSKEEVERWTNETFTPHLSLVYSGLWPVPKDVSEAMERDVTAANIGMSCSSHGKPQDTMNGWEGGMILLVQTEKSIEEWVPLAGKVVG